MNRRHVAFACEGATLIGTVDGADAATGLLLVTGGNELRSGAWGGQAELAARIAAAGFPVFRFDRRGMGDSDGPPDDFRASGPDIAAALAEFRRQCPALTRIIGFGNCDAASALMLAGGARLDGLVLSNPWTIESDDAPPPPAVLRGHYGRRLRDPAALMRVLGGKVSLRKLAASLRDALRPASPPSSLAQDMAAGIADFTGPIAILLAERDRTAKAFQAAWNKSDGRIRVCANATHGFVEPQARAWLADQVLAILRASPAS